MVYHIIRANILLIVRTFLHNSQNIHAYYTLYVRPLRCTGIYYAVRSTVEPPLTVNSLWHHFFWTDHTITPLILTCSTIQLFNLYFDLFKVWSWTDLRKNIFHDFYLLCQSSIVFRLLFFIHLICLFLTINWITIVWFSSFGTM